MSVKSISSISSVEISLTKIPKLKEFCNIEDDKCPVCFDIPSEPILYACDHFICASCDKVLHMSGQSSCPMCRYALSDAHLDANECREQLDLQRKLYQVRDQQWSYYERSHEKLEALVNMIEVRKTKDVA